MSTLRQLVVDTETTGFSPDSGDKIVEIGAVELINHIPTTSFFHKYINPERSMPDSAFKVHGLSFDFLKEKPVFLEVADEFLNFIGNDEIIIHNAPFDLSFLNKELVNIGKSAILVSQVVDTLVMAREKFPGSPASLDALCRRFSINNSNRKLHGALLDSYILAQVYLELIGGQQPDFNLENSQRSSIEFENRGIVSQKDTFNRPKSLPNRITTEEISAHKKLIEDIGGLKSWSIYK